MFGHAWICVPIGFSTALLGFGSEILSSNTPKIKRGLLFQHNQSLDILVYLELAAT